MQPFGPKVKFHHIGIATPSIEEEKINYEKIKDTKQKAIVSFGDLYGLSFELVEPLGSDSSVHNVLKRGQKLYHICFQVKSLEESISIAKKYGYVQLTKPVSATAFNNRKIVWLHSDTFGLVELLEEKK